tara:strand:- start:479 stop:871 length:393 start_codon:yes stop_codon:yes gene_type:complete
MQALTFIFPNFVNTSIQTGDIAFYVPTQLRGSTLNNYATGDLNMVLMLGEIIRVNTATGDIYPSAITVLYDETVVTIAPTIGDFLMFAKNRKANTSSLKGYYAEIDMVNDSYEETVELFSIGLQGSASSN